MTNGDREHRRGPAVPPPQHNFEDAAARALEGVRRQSAAQLEWLGASGGDAAWTVPVLEATLEVDLHGGTVCRAGGEPVGPWWRILTLHYLAVTGRPDALPAAVSFAELPAARAYAPVYHQRVIGRLCGTAGRRRESLVRGAAAVAGRPASLGDLSWDFQVYPRVGLRLIWHAGDEEFGPSATLLLPRNIESFFPVEDIVVLSEGLVRRLAGRNL